MSAVVDVVSAVLLLAGVLLALVAAVGLLRFPDLFSRMHAATKPAVLGLLLVLGGTALQLASPGDAAELALVAVFQLLTAPVAAHMIGRAAYRSGITCASSGDMDELAGFSGGGRSTAQPDPQSHPASPSTPHPTAGH